MFDLEIFEKENKPKVKKMVNELFQGMDSNRIVILSQMLDEEIANRIERRVNPNNLF